ncbi:hypothetical protein H4P12_17435 [Paracoccus sp. 11-3]|uniref:SecDF P1 head subdomain domain-containing protein n=1 Tax=Paracoccus amoyensis TaxID=2760093 RepID=A0A926GCG1_9RHOB|nr:hypothetical protein [Paracoccus amoyensis]MBC9248448.1 hypothetical protein [Paracoccus amoyensis]
MSLIRPIIAGAMTLLALVSPAMAETLNLRVTGGQISDSGDTLNVELARQSQRDFATFTQLHVGQRMAIMLDDKVLISPMLRGPIFASSGQLSLPLLLSPEEVVALRDRLGSGKLFLRVTAPAQ